MSYPTLDELKTFINGVGFPIVVCLILFYFNLQLVEKQNKSVEALIDATEITVPESMIDNEVNRQFQDFARRVQQMGLNTDQYFQITK